MIQVRGYAAHDAHSPLVPFTFERRAPGPHDVQIEILYAGICHSDLHQTRDHCGWGFVSNGTGSRDRWSRRRGRGTCQ